MFRFARITPVVVATLITQFTMASNPDPFNATANRLIHETSPYLLQHAHNPVDWFPWGEEAFRTARERNVPIFLSIGYSTCYWCHVMERESFENEETARLMNELFVCIKVDREERPDVDDIYMAAVQLMTGRGGWPLSAWLTPPGAAGDTDKGLRPFFTGTYFPPESRHGIPSFKDVLRNISDAWQVQRGEVVKQADQVTRAIEEYFAKSAEPASVDEDDVNRASLLLLRTFDREHGGFGVAPKFPQPAYLEFLLDVADSIPDAPVQSLARKAIRITLDRMALGGMYDQVGGGFHRYSTDAIWLIPHFEKMLYDNGQLASVYARSYAAAGDRFDARITRDILRYVQREMTSADGAFYSAQDAEVNAREGQNYLWNDTQLKEVLQSQDAAFASRIYGVDKGPNFRDPHHPQDALMNVLFMPERPESLAEAMGLSEGEFFDREESIDQRLLEFRDNRDQPRLDDKIIVAWNGLMIRGFADAANHLGEPEYLTSATRAADFILQKMRTKDGGLLRIYRNGEAHTSAFLEDYALFASGLIAISRAQRILNKADADYLDSAQQLCRDALHKFSDPNRPGLLCETLPDQADLIVRAQQAYDGAIPSAASSMLNNAIDLYELTHDPAWLDTAINLLSANSSAIADSPIGAINSTRALHRLLKIDSERVRSIAKDCIDSRTKVSELPVQILAADDRVTVPRTGSVSLPLRLQVSEGFHITSHEPGVAGLVPLTVTLTGSESVQMTVDYPQGQELQVGGLPQDLPAPRVHSGPIDLVLTFSRSPVAWEGRPVILVTWQACTDHECMAPMTVELDVAIDQGR